MKRKLVGALFTAAALVTAVGAGTASARNANPTLAEVLLSDSGRDGPEGFDRNPFDYDIVTQAVLLFPELVEAASDPDAELTAFLPNDLAFGRLVADLTGTAPGDERSTFDAVAGLGTDTVRTVLEYHIVAGPPISYRAALRSDGAELETLQGGIVTVDVKRFFFFFRYVELVDLDDDDRNPIVVQPSVGRHLANGYAHGIDRVLRPVDL